MSQVNKNSAESRMSSQKNLGKASQLSQKEIVAATTPADETFDPAMGASNGPVEVKSITQDEPGSIE